MALVSMPLLVQFFAFHVFLKKNLCLVLILFYLHWPFSNFVILLIESCNLQWLYLFMMNFEALGFHKIWVVSCWHCFLSTRLLDWILC